MQRTDRRKKIALRKYMYRYVQLDHFAWENMLNNGDLKEKEKEFFWKKSLILWNSSSQQGVVWRRRRNAKRESKKVGHNSVHEAVDIPRNTAGRGEAHTSTQKSKKAGKRTSGSVENGHIDNLARLLQINETKGKHLKYFVYMVNKKKRLIAAVSSIWIPLSQL